MRTVFIYALNCPITGQTRYVGKTVNLKERLASHLSTALRHKNHRACWIRSLLAKGLKPVLEILQEVSEENWEQLEVAYLEFFREQGCDLVNSTEGGGGMHNPSEEVILKLRNSHKGQKPWNLGKPSSPAAIEKHRIAVTGRKQSPEERKKRHESAFGKKEPSNTSGFVGIGWLRKNKKWCANFVVNKKQIYVGCFKNIEDAVLARALAVDKYFSP